MSAVRRTDVDLLMPDFRSRLYSLEKALHDEGIPLRVFETIRSPERQGILYARGRDPNAPDFGRIVTRAQAYQSAHQHGGAADFAFFLDGRWSWEEPAAGMWLQFGALADKFKLERIRSERPHVEMPGPDWKSLPRGPMDYAGWLTWLAARNRGAQS